MTRPGGMVSTSANTSSAKSSGPPTKRHDMRSDSDLPTGATHNGRVRPQVVAAQRIVVKVGSSSLTSPAAGGAAGGLDRGCVDALVDALARAGQRAEVLLVSSGAIAAGLAP